MVFTVLLDAVKECYNGFKVGLNHDYWIVKLKAEKVAEAIKGVFRPSTSTAPSNSASYDASDAKSPVDGFKVVGVGFGRTGTYSLGLALNRLGYPTLHTYHLYENSDILEMWTEQVFRPSIISKQISMGRPDFDTILAHGFSAAVDFPIALYYDQLSEKYPDCKFVLTLRQDPEAWYKSWRTMAINIAQTTNIGAGILKLEHVRQLSLYLR